MDKREQLKNLLRFRYAHRGLHQKPYVPENSMTAFKRAVLEGFGIELDLHLTKDERLAVIHDGSLKRTCGVDLQIEDLTLQEAQVYFLEQSQERIPEFCDVLEAVAGRVPLIVELKAGKDSQGKDTTARLCALAVKALAGYRGMYCMESFSPLAVKWLRKNRPEVIRGQLAGDLNQGKKTLPAVENWLLKNLLVNWAGKPDFVAYRFDNHEEKSIKAYKGPVFFWTIREYADLKTAESLGAAGIFEGFNPHEYEESLK